MAVHNLSLTWNCKLLYEVRIYAIGVHGIVSAEATHVEFFDDDEGIVPQGGIIGEVPKLPAPKKEETSQDVSILELYDKASWMYSAKYLDLDPTYPTVRMKEK